MDRWSVILMVAACNLLVGATTGYANADVKAIDGESRQLVNSAIRITHLEEKLNETLSRFQQLKTIQRKDPSERLKDTGIISSSNVYLVLNNQNTQIANGEQSPPPCDVPAITYRP